MSDEELSIKESITNSIKEIRDREEPEAEKPVVDDPPEEKPVEEEQEESSDPPVEEEQEPTEEAPLAPKVEADRTLINPPSTWTARGKSLWAALPEDARKEVLRREGNIKKGIEQYKTKAEFGERLERTMTPYQPFLKAKGASAERVIEDALNLAYQLETSNPEQKALILKKIGQQYGADFRVFTEQQDPEQDKLLQAISPLQQKIEALERERQNSLFANKQQQSAQLERTVEDFASATDDTGRLKHPYFDDVKDLMASLLESNRVQTLDAAYQLAVQADPEISKLARVSSSQQISSEAKARADKAKRNEQVAPSKKPTQVSSAQSGSIRDTINARLKQIRAT